MKMGDQETTHDSLEKLETHFNDIKSTLIKLSELYSECSDDYTNKIQEQFNEESTYFEPEELLKIHQQNKKAALDKVRFSNELESRFCMIFKWNVMKLSLQKLRNMEAVSSHLYFNTKSKKKLREILINSKKRMTISARNSL